MQDRSDWTSIAGHFDAVYFAPGPELWAKMCWACREPAEGRIKIDPLTLATSQAKVFAGGAQRYAPAPYSPIASLADGNYAAVSIDRFLQGASLSANRDNQGPYASRLYVNTIGLDDFTGGSSAARTNSYSKEEAQQEAARCIPCQCLECVKVCSYLEEYGSYPKSYVRQIYNNECIVMGVRKANRMVNSCTLCGLCTSVCPENFSMADVILDARQSMVRTHKMPPSAHDFAFAIWSSARATRLRWLVISRDLHRARPCFFLAASSRRRLPAMWQAAMSIYAKRCLEAWA